MLIHLCDSCKDTRTPAADENPQRTPEGWSKITVDRTTFMLCPQCAAMPKTFGNIKVLGSETPSFAWPT